MQLSSRLLLIMLRRLAHQAPDHWHQSGQPCHSAMPLLLEPGLMSGP